MHTDPQAWAEHHFGNAQLGDVRLNRRLPRVVTKIADNPQISLPQAFGDPRELDAMYHLISCDRISPEKILQPHRDRTFEQCRERERILVVQDGTQLDLSKQAKRGSIQGVGPLGKEGGGGAGLLQHTALAVEADRGSRGRILGVLDQNLFVQTRPNPGETRSQRRQRETSAQCWEKAARSVNQGQAGSCRLIHVGDRHADVFSFFESCRELGHGFVVRAMHDRYVSSADESLENDEKIGKLFASIDRVDPSTTERQVTLQRKRRSNGKVVEQSVKIRVSYQSLSLNPPRNDPRFTGHDSIDVGVVLVEEAIPNEDFEPIRWVLLHDEDISNADQAWRVVDWYSCRWRIEEWHRCLKEGCRLEKHRFDQADDVRRLAMILGPVAVRLLWLRDLAEDSVDAEDREALAAVVAPSLLMAVALLAGVKPGALTPTQFWLTIALRGGYQPRRGTHPGWIVIWRGWREVSLVAQGVSLGHSNGDPPQPP